MGQYRAALRARARRRRQARKQSLARLMFLMVAPIKRRLYSGLSGLVTVTPMGE